MAESIRLRKNAEQHDVAILRIGEKLIASAIAESEDTDQDVIIRAAAPIAFQITYPRYEPWSGQELLDLLGKLRDLIHDIASQKKPIVSHELGDAMEFCTQMRAALANMANGH